MAPHASSHRPGPLEGKRVLVTRAAHQAEPTIELLESHGAQAVAFPLIGMEPPPDRERLERAAQEIDRYDLVAFTSANAVEALWAELERQGRDAQAFSRLSIAAIGPGTAAALYRLGLEPAISAKHYVAEELARAILLQLGERAGSLRALLPQALVARPTLAEALEGAGLQVDAVPVYRTVPASLERAAELRSWLRQGAIDIITLTSGSTAERLCDLLGHEAPALLGSVAIASIGPVTTRTAERLGLRVAVTAEQSTIPGLVDALLGQSEPPAP